MISDVAIEAMEQGDAVKLGFAFAEWGKTVDKYRTYYEQQQQDSRVVLVADIKATIVAYVTVVWQPVYEWFRRHEIPEIVDLNVMTRFQRQGIGTRLILAAEDLARRRSKTRLGISVQQSPEFAAAQRLYLMLSYVPDGHGVTPHDNELHLMKNLTAEAHVPR
jgi:GNAT superfamily N-acetyltransferase